MTYRITRRTTPILFFLSFLFVCFIPLNTKAQACSSSDSLALIKLYDVTTGLNWDVNQTFDSWQGITVAANGCVIRIQLDGLITGGTIPYELGNIEHLLELDLEDCNLTGSIPSSLSYLTNLVELDLEGNNLTGTIPASLATLPNLSELVLIDNNLSGCYVPQLSPLCSVTAANHQISNGNNFDGPWANFCANQSYECSTCREQDSITLLTVMSNFNSTSIDISTPIDTWRGVELNANGCVKTVNWSDCCISGGILAPEIGNLASLEFFDINENRLRGEIPSEIGNLTQLKILDLGQNNFSGMIPSEIGNLSNLESLNLGENSLEGHIPVSVGHLINLTYLNFCSNTLSGSIPVEIGNLVNLNILYLMFNQLTGSIPAEIGNLSNLTSLLLNNNNLSGCFEPELSNLCAGLPSNNSYINNGNNFDANWDDFCASQDGICIDCAITDSLSLIALYNATTGLNWNINAPMSTWQGISTNAEGCVIRVQLDGLITSGSIPTNLGDMENLLELDLEDCHLTGFIPYSLGNLSNLVELDLEGNNLIGSIPVSLASLPSLNELVLIDNNLSGCYDAQLQALCNVTNANHQISNGNNFDGGWFNFCNAQLNECAPCRERDSLALLAIFANFEFSDIDVSGPIDTWTGVTLNSNGCVSEIDISDCCLFNGELAPEVGDLSELEVLRFDEINLTGPIPVEIQNLSNLKELRLSDNIQLGIPSEIGNLSNLEILQLDDIDGPIPSEITNLTNLTFLTIYGANSGNIPSDIDNLTELTFLNISDSDFTGGIPPEIGNLENLETLILEFNNFSGQIPPELGDLINLTHLNIRNNVLTGPIPSEFGNLVNLDFLGLVHNALSGCFDPALKPICSSLNPNINTSFFIDLGNSFSAPWEDFCASDAGICIEGCTDASSVNFNPNANVPITSCVYPGFTCYAVSEFNSSPNKLFNFNELTQSWTEVGVTGTSFLEAMAFDQSTGILYAFDTSTFGTINPVTGEFIEIGSLGTANGELGPIELNDIDGLTYDPSANVMYATHRINGSNDLLFIVDMNTGNFVPNGMQNNNGNAADYAVIEEAFDTDSGALGFNVDDIAINPQTGELFASQNSGLSGVISIINKQNGSLEQIIYDLSAEDIEGLAFNNNNQLVATTGSGAQVNPNSYLIIDYINQTETSLGAIDPINGAKDFECVACFQAAFSNCPDELLISNSISIDYNRSANINIDSDAQIVSGQSMFAAGQHVELLSDFEVSIGAIFIADIEACQ